MREGDWKLVRPGFKLANCMKGWERDLKLYADVDLNPEKYLDGVPDAIGIPPCVGVAPVPPLLFNLASDPLEATDLSSKHPEIVNRMLCELEEWFEDVEKDRSTIKDKPYRCAETFMCNCNKD